MKLLLRTIFISFLATAICCVAACKKSETGQGGDTGATIKVGEVGSLTGSEATFGVSTHQGIELAMKSLNAAGGVKGKQFELVTVDDQSRPDEAATATTKLITQDGVLAILGEVASSRSLAMAPIAQQYGIPMISPSSTNPKVTEQGTFIFRVCFIDPFQGEVMSKFALDILKVKKAAILRDVKNDYSIGLAEFFIKHFKANGGEILIDQSYSNGDTDFKAQLTSIAARKPEVVFVPGYYGDVALIARQAKSSGLKVSKSWHFSRLAISSAARFSARDVT